MGGAGGASDSLFAYQGLAWAPSGLLGGSGPQLQLWTTGLTYSYDTTIHGAVRRIRARGLVLEALGGWQLASPQYRMAFYVGPTWRNNRLEPDAPSSGHARRHFGLVLQVQGELRLGEWGGLLASARHVVRFVEYRAELRPYWRFTSGAKVGPVLAFDGGADYAFARAGVFFSDWTVPLPGKGHFYLGGESALRLDIDSRRKSLWLALHLSRRF